MTNDPLSRWEHHPDDQTHPEGVPPERRWDEIPDVDHEEPAPRGRVSGIDRPLRSRREPHTGPRIDVGSLPRWLPHGLRLLLVECAVAEGLRATTQRSLLEHGRSIELAYFLFGKPPTEATPARVTSYEPLDSTSGGASVEVSTRAQVEAFERHARSDAPDTVLLGVAHSHPGDAIPVRSEIDQLWHSRLLRMLYRQELVLSLPVRDDHFAPHQVLYSIVLPGSGAFVKTSGYLIASRVPPDPRVDHLDGPIPLVLAESVDAEREVGARHLSIVPVSEQHSSEGALDLFSVQHGSAGAGSAGSPGGEG